MQVSDRWEQGDAYERYVGRWSRPIAAQFLTWLEAPRGIRWLDVGCGTGALTEAILDQCEPASMVGVEPSAGFLETAHARLGDRAALLQGDAAHLPLADASADAVVSGLVLNFVPDPDAALTEFVRVATPGGTIAAYVWDYAEGMRMMREFWDVAAEVDPDGAALDESARFPICRPGALAALFSNATGDEALVVPLDANAVFADFDDYWEPFLGGQGAAPAYVMALDDDRRAAIRERLRERLPVRRDGTIELATRAWAVRTRVAEAPAPRA
jgi:trans-aconitate methyltransferase